MAVTVYGCPHLPTWSGSELVQCASWSGGRRQRRRGGEKKEKEEMNTEKKKKKRGRGQRKRRGGGEIKRKINGDMKLEGGVGAQEWIWEDLEFNLHWYRFYSEGKWQMCRASKNINILSKPHQTGKIKAEQMFKKSKQKTKGICQSG